MKRLFITGHWRTTERSFQCTPSVALEMSHFKWLANCFLKQFKYNRMAFDGFSSLNTIQRIGALPDWTEVPLDSINSGNLQPFRLRCLSIDNYRPYGNLSSDSTSSEPESHFLNSACYHRMWASVKSHHRTSPRTMNKLWPAKVRLPNQTDDSSLDMSVCKTCTV